MKQEALYETEQYANYKGKKLKIVFDEEYFDAVPRPIPEERQQLKEDIQIDGLHEDIRINPKGIVLDGHTRIEICEELGWKKSNGEPIKAKYTVKEFKDKEGERNYVIKTNLMRRQLNVFQKVRLVAKLYKVNPHTQREQTRYDVLLELKKNESPIKAQIISDKLDQNKANILRILKGLKEDFCVRFEEEEKASSGTHKAFLFSILPKGEEVLYKGRPNKITIKSLGRSIGVQRDYLSRAIFLIDHANDFMLAKLECGKIGIMKAFVELTKEENITRVSNNHYLKATTKVVCPHCDKVSMKQEWKVYNGTD